MINSHWTFITIPTIKYDNIIYPTAIYIWDIKLMWVCRNVIGTTHQIDGWNPTHKNGDDFWGWCK